MSKQKRMNEAVGKNLGKPIPTAPFQEYDETIFAAMAEAEVQDSTLPIMQIVPDRTQPRRIVPYEIYRDWDGTPQGYGALIDAWENRAHKGVKWSFPVDILLGKASVSDLKTDDPLVLNFAELLGFAANIRDIGLNHPIGVVKRGDYHRIVFGERRWTGFQILNHYLGQDEDWSSIPVKIATAGEWELAKAQAAENNQSKRLNAIGRAREFAKLLMIARSDGGERYDSWNQLVNPGGCDRGWYAQVANGELHRIPRNMGQQFEHALNISAGQMRNYRNLLRLTEDHKVNDALWQLGDRGDWSENFMREVAQYLNVTEIHEILSSTDGYTVTTVTVYATESALHKAVKAKKEAEEEARKATELAQQQAAAAAALAAQQAAAEVGDTAGDSDSQNGGQPADDPDKSAWASLAWVQRWAIVGASSFVWVVEATGPQTVNVVKGDGNTIDKDAEPKPLHIVALRAPEAATRTSAGTQPDSKVQPANLTSKAAQTITGAVGIVQWDANGYVSLRFPDDTTAQMEKRFVSYVPMSEWHEAVRRHNETKNSNKPAPATPATATATGTPGRNLTTAQLVGKPVLYNGIAAFVKATSGSESVLIKIGRDERIVHKDTLVLNPTAPEQTLKDYMAQTELAGGDADYDEDELLDEEDGDTPDIITSDPPDYEPFDMANLEVLGVVADLADQIDHEWAFMLDDLCKIDRNRLQRWVTESGIDEIELAAADYRKAAVAVLQAVQQRIETHIARVIEIAREIKKGN